MRILKMKKIFLLAASLVMVSAQAQDIIVRSFKQSEADFTKYGSYFWAAQASSETDDFSYFMNDLVFKSDIRDAVRNELEALGYQADQVTPDLLINFRVFEKPATLNGFEGYGVHYWKNDEYLPSIGDRVEVSAGTIILSIIDRREGVLVWEGIAEGLVTQGEFIKEEGKLREAVNLIFKEFGVRASEYTKR
jgi:hypothetical protein